MISNFGSIFNYDKQRRKSASGSLGIRNECQELLSLHRIFRQNYQKSSMIDKQHDVCHILSPYSYILLIKKRKQ